MRVMPEIQDYYNPSRSHFNKQDEDENEDQEQEEGFIHYMAYDFINSRNSKRNVILDLVKILK